MSGNCYLAGPMTGIEEYNFPAFHRAAADLRARGWVVFSPAEKDEADGFNPKTDTAKTLKEYMVDDLAAVCRSDAVICLPGWESSTGANLEMHVARVCGIPVLAYGEELNEIPPNPDSVCAEADRLVSGDRGNVYGHPLDDFTKITGMARALWGRGPETPEEHALYMILVKLSRLTNTPGHHDSIVDICGYAKTYKMVLEERDRRSKGSGDEQPGDAA